MGLRFRGVETIGFDDVCLKSKTKLLHEKNAKNHRLREEIFIILYIIVLWRQIEGFCYTGLQIALFGVKIKRIKNVKK